MPKQLVRDEFCRLINAVLERLKQRKAADSYLTDEWASIVSAEQDPAQRSFCERAARLGCDPFALDDGMAKNIEELGSLLPESLIDDFCDSIRLSQFSSGAAAVQDFVKHANISAPEAGRWGECSEFLSKCTSATPWRDGYQKAREFRAYLGWEGPAPENFLGTLRESLGPLEIRSLATLDGIDAISAPTFTGAPVFGLRDLFREDQKRFNISRALSDFLPSGQPSLVTRGRSEHQQRNRAFAAEFLAPAESIKQRLSGRWVGDEEMGEIAQEFRVSDLVIRHQIQNHQLAKIYI